VSLRGGGADEAISIPRKYFSGGIVKGMATAVNLKVTTDLAMGAQEMRRLTWNGEMDFATLAATNQVPSEVERSAADKAMAILILSDRDYYNFKETLLGIRFAHERSRQWWGEAITELRDFQDRVQGRINRKAAERKSHPAFRIGDPDDALNGDVLEMIEYTSKRLQQVDSAMSIQTQKPDAAMSALKIGEQVTDGNKNQLGRLSSAGTINATTLVGGLLENRLTMLELTYPEGYVIQFQFDVYHSQLENPTVAFYVGNDLEILRSINEALRKKFPYGSKLNGYYGKTKKEVMKQAAADFRLIIDNLRQQGRIPPDAAMTGPNETAEFYPWGEREPSASFFIYRDFSGGVLNLGFNKIYPNGRSIVADSRGVFLIASSPFGQGLDILDHENLTSFIARDRMELTLKGEVDREGFKRLYSQGIPQMV
jgi:hypothetical protein